MHLVWRAGICIGHAYAARLAVAEAYDKRSWGSFSQFAFYFLFFDEANDGTTRVKLPNVLKRKKEGGRGRWSMHIEQKKYDEIDIYLYFFCV